MYFFFTIFLCLSIAGPQTVSGKTAALKYFKNYNPIESEAQPQNWNILQDKRGFIYVANQGGVLQYDGVSWRIILIPNQTARSLAIDKQGTVYVGGRNEFGFLTRGANSSLHYVSLLKYPDEKKRNFGNVWRTHVTKEGIYYCTYKFLFRWNSHSGQLKVWEPETEFSSTSFIYDNNLFMRLKKKGLVKLKEDALVSIPGGELFSEMSIHMVVPYEPGSQKLLIGTLSDGLFIYDGQTAVPFPTEADDYLKKNRMYYGTRLSSSSSNLSPVTFALATLKGGLVIIDSRGHLINVFDKDFGLRDDNVKYVFEDSTGNLWLALNNGIAKIEYASPISFYDAERSNLPGIVLSISRHGSDNKIYAGTTSGLYGLTPTGQFDPVPGIPGLCWSLLSHSHGLLAATTHGLFLVKNNIVNRIIEYNSYCLSRSLTDTNRIWVGTARGLTSLYLERGKWEVEDHKFSDITMEIRTIAEEKNGSLWLGTLSNCVFNVNFPVTGKLENATVTVYKTEQGLPTGELHAFMAADHVMIASAKGIFRFDEKNKTFVPDTTLGAEFAGGPQGKGMFRISEDKNKHIWLHSFRKNYQAIPQPDGIFRIIKEPFLRIPKIQSNWIYPDPDGMTTWFATHKGIIRYDNRVKKDYHRRFPVFIRRVLVNGRPVFAGYRSGSGEQKHFPVIPYRDRNLRFEYAAPFFENETNTLYSFRLDGYDDHWSAWTGETKKDYTNLDAGSYTFRIRAKNIYRQESTRDTYRFKVLPPWYLTWWAFSLYTLAFFFIVFIMVKWRSRKLVRDKKQLEQIVKTRTTEVYEKNLLLEEQSEKLKDMDQIKSRFFANISHEFRTPLTLIMGPMELLLSGKRDKKETEVINMALQNSQRLLSLINQLLDLSKLDSGKLQLRTSLQNIIPFLKGLVSSFESLAVQEELELSFHCEEEEIILYFDPEKLEKVIVNLVANAIKFTPAGGEITVTADIYASGGQGGAFRENCPPGPPFSAKAFDKRFGYLEIVVKDTGIGIPGDQLPYIFDRFYQAGDSGSQEHKQKGTGIGLALVKELVCLHKGEIHAQSKEGKGTEFIVRLPLGSDHLKKEEIVKAETPILHRETYWNIVHDSYKQMQVEVESDIEKKERDVILVVEDNADMRRYMRGPLETLYTVVEAVDGKDGIDKAKKLVPDLIVSDIMMPGVDGYKLCKTLKNNVASSHIPIILLTAKASDESMVRGLETGADDYITKPFNIKILLTRIKNLIDLRRHLQDKIQKEMVLQPMEIEVSSIDHEFMRELKEVVEKNLSDPDFGVEQLKKTLHMGRTTLNRKIKAITGQSTNQFIQSYRLKRAAQLLKANFGNVTEVAFEVGFSSSPYFTKCFKEKFHQLPHSFQASESQ